MIIYDYNITHGYNYIKYDDIKVCLMQFAYLTVWTIRFKWLKRSDFWTISGASVSVPAECDVFCQRSNREMMDMNPMKSTGIITSVSKPHTGHTATIRLHWTNKLKWSNFLLKSPLYMAGEKIEIIYHRATWHSHYKTMPFSQLQGSGSGRQLSLNR